VTGFLRIESFLGWRGYSLTYEFRSNTSYFVVRIHGEISRET
jgi:hypothetical protein